MDLCGPRLCLRHRALGRRRCDWPAALCERIAPFTPRTLASSARNWLPALRTWPWPVRTRADPARHSPRPTRVRGLLHATPPDVVPLARTRSPGRITWLGRTDMPLVASEACQASSESMAPSAGKVTEAH